MSFKRPKRAQLRRDDQAAIRVSLDEADEDASPNEWFISNYAEGLAKSLRHTAIEIGFGAAA